MRQRLIITVNKTDIYNGTFVIQFNMLIVEEPIVQ